MLAIVGLLLAAFFFLVYRQVLTIVQKPSWPPAADAITAAGAQLATEHVRRPLRPDARRRRDALRLVDGGDDRAVARGQELLPEDLRRRRAGPLVRAHPHVRLARRGDRHGARRPPDREDEARASRCAIIVDGQGSQVFGPAGPMFTRLADAGAQIVVNDLLPWDKDGLYPDHRSFDWRQDDVGRADHRKLYVIDGEGRLDRRRRDRGSLRERQVPRRHGARDRQRRPPGAGALPDELPRPRRAAARATSRSTSRRSPIPARSRSRSSRSCPAASCRRRRRSAS